MCAGGGGDCDVGGGGVSGVDCGGGGGLVGGVDFVAVEVCGLLTNSHSTNPGVCWAEDRFV